MTADAHVPISADAVAAFLRRRVDGARDVVPLGRGEWSQAFAFRAGHPEDPGEYVARFGPHRDDYEKDRVAHRYAAPGLPIPEVIAVGAAFGGAYAISARAHGDALDRLDAPRFRAALPSVFRMLDAMREADLSGTTGYGTWDAQGRAPYASWRETLLDVQHDREGSRTHGWWDLLRRADGAVDTFRAGYRELRALAAGLPEGRHLVHADLVGDNVRVAGDAVTAVVDWGNAMYGDFLYDLARLDFWRPWYPELADVDVLSAARAHLRSLGVDVPSFDERVRCYEVHIGLDAQAYDAFTERWRELERAAARTLEVARRR